ncbi:MAG TPA: hypothetical protein VGW99_04260, partial [Chthoniobacterales bacterium]|nr:hypothetical protein [Chthoniobacterales bacterium]
MRLHNVAVALIFSAIPLVSAQEAFNQRLPTQGPGAAVAADVAPESAWIDLRQSAAARFTTQSAPSWVEAVSKAPTAAMDGNANTVFRIRVTHPAGDYRVLFFR